MDEDLGVPVDPLVKFVIRNLGVFDADFVRHDKAGLGLASNDEVAEISVVGLDVALPRTEGETLRTIVSLAGTGSFVDH